MDRRRCVDENEENEGGSIHNQDIQRELHKKFRKEHNKRVHKLHKLRLPERLCAAVVSIVFLWCTSLSICASVVQTYIPPPNQPAMIASIQATSNLTGTLKNEYEICAERLSQDCELEIDGLIQSAKAITAYFQLQNEQTIASVYKRRDTCLARLNNVTATLQAIQRSVTNNSTSFVPSTNGNCSYVNGILKSSAGGTGAIQVTAAFATNANTQNANINSQLVARAQYDATYMSNKTNGFQARLFSPIPFVNASVYINQLWTSYENMMACVSISGTYGSATCKTVPKYFGQMNSYEMQIQAYYNEFKSELDTYTAEIVADLNVIAPYVNVLNDQNLRTAMDAAFILESQATLSAMGWYGNIIPDLAVFNLTNPLAGFNPLDVQGLSSQFQAQAQALYEPKLRSLQQLAANQTAALVAAQQSIINQPLPPYHPPPTILTNANWTDTFAVNMATQLQGALYKPDQVGAILQSSSISEVFATQNLSSTTLQGVVVRPYTFFTYPDISFQLLLDAWNALIQVAFIFDYAWRGFRTFQLIRKCWTISQVTIPPADVRVESMQAAALSVGHSNPIQFALMCLVHPLTLIITVLTFGLVLFTLLIQVYEPILHSFDLGCVANEITCPNASNIDVGQGTVLSRNVYSVSNAYASSSGERIINTEFARLNAQKAVVCNSEFDASSVIYAQDTNNFSFAIASLQDVTVQTQAILGCLNLTKIDLVYNTSLHMQLPDSFCTWPLPSSISLFDSLFPCENIFCDKPMCTRPDQSVLKASTWESSCYGEWYVHSTLLGVLATLTMFTLLNLSRVYILRGCIRLQWRRLTDTQTMSFMGTCDVNGFLKWPETKMSLFQQNREEQYLKKRVGENLHQFHRASIFTLGIGILFNIPWIFMLAYINTTFAPNVQDMKQRLNAQCQASWNP